MLKTIFASSLAFTFVVAASFSPTTSAKGVEYTPSPTQPVIPPMIPPQEPNKPMCEIIDVMQCPPGY
ncbi:hypothetical protein MN202_07520 [Rheinheimera muenzenbergensis]|uniref:Uncharacterized protein n=1 Tax=Rheinheimera muenzenbergensis TaxID=1193628 RepID=A0ABU8C5L3_9GAMM|nr:hypothetical protein [Gammaproteobacteria bacterium]MBU1554200.1 hypothetical protein [Gammaproteobacteria bacterium]MBU2070537.1 hypothetical protein [Gammaproteobacteria bacterium]MBU2185349.1 hypothetical protein [Gammaproteobacteria bacterium]MBU2207043.1 hypothetical protein [Gammaproteobacteria bacterium]